MTARALIVGEVTRMARRLAKNGASYVALNVVRRERRSSSSVVVFDERLAAAIEARLRTGVDAAFAGKLYAPPGRSDPILVADAAMTESGVLRGRGAGAKPPRAEGAPAAALLPWIGEG